MLKILFYTSALFENNKNSQKGDERASRNRWEMIENEKERERERESES